MDVLHICRSEPDETVRALIEEVSGPGAETLDLFREDVDWSRVLEAILAADKVISWW